MKDVKKIALGLVVFVAVLCLGILAHTAFVTRGRIDDWKFVPTAFTGYGLTMADLFSMPNFTQYWYVYLIALIVLVLYVLPIGIFLQGVWIFFRTIHDKNKRSRGTHKIAIGLPMVLFVVLLACILFVAAKGFDADSLFGIPSTILASILVGCILFIEVCIVAPLFIRGLYTWIKYRKEDQDKKRRGRTKALFALLEFVLLVIPFLIYFVMMQTTNAVMPSGSAGSYPMPGSSGSAAEYSTGTAQYFGTASSIAPSAQRDTSIGLSVGGAKDVNNFRENLKNGFLPLPTDVTYEGLFYDYTFDTGIQEPCQKLFCPSYASAVSKDPFSQKDEYFLSVGLNSGIQQKDFVRKKMNLVVVLDISGSMGSPFDAYYYDRFGRKNTAPTVEEKKDADKSKMKVASEAVAMLLDHLKDDDSFGMVLFDSEAYLAKPLRKVDLTDMAKIKGHIRELQEQGSTNMSAGIKEAAAQFDEYAYAKSSDYENRIIFLTDAMPNVGDTTDEDLFALGKNLADKKIYTTFIGVGVDFNSELVESLTKIRGANYYSVNSPIEFKKRMDEGFDFMVSPLVFNLRLAVKTPGYTIEKVYGSAEANEATGEIMHVNTLFPSERTDGETRGGLVLLQLKKISSDPSISLIASYEDRSGKQESTDASISFKDQSNYYDTSGIRKGILLTRYANLLRDWMFFERASGTPEELKKERPTEPIFYYGSEGIPITSPEFVLGKWERESMPLRISSDYKKLFSDFAPYATQEKNTIGDGSLQKELDVLNLLITTSGTK